jgi:hypothetical protein
MTKFVTYTTQTNATMRAAIRTQHRDGSVTVEPFFYQKDGNDIGMFQGGHTLRLTADQVTPWTWRTSRKTA